MALHKRLLETGQVQIRRAVQSSFIRQSVNTMLLRILGVITLFGFTLFLTHNYDPEIIGQYDFIRTYLLLSGSICILGTDQSVLYFTGIIKSVQNTHSIKKIYIKMIAMIFVASLVILGLVLIIGKNLTAAFFHDDVIFHVILKATGILFFYSITLFNTETLRALEAFYSAELFRNTFKYLSVIIGAVVLFYIDQESYLVETFLIGFIILSVISTIMIFRILDKEKATHYEEYSYGHILRKSFPMAVSTIAIFLLMSFDVIFLKKYKGNTTVAYYSVSVKLMTILLMVMNSVTITVSTKIAKYFHLGNREELKKIMRNSARMIFFITLPIVVVFCMFANTILGVFGEDYTASKNSLLILMIGQCICSLFGAVQVYLNMTDRQNIFQGILAVAVVINLILNQVLIPIYGMNGAAIAYVSSMLFWNAAAALFIYKKDKIAVFLS